MASTGLLDPGMLNREEGDRGALAPVVVSAATACQSSERLFGQRGRVSIQIVQSSV